MPQSMNQRSWTYSEGDARGRHCKVVLLMPLVSTSQSQMGLRSSESHCSSTEPSGSRLCILGLFVWLAVDSMYCEIVALFLLYLHGREVASMSKRQFDICSIAVAVSGFHTPVLRL